MSDIGRPFNRKLIIYGVGGFVVVATLGFIIMTAGEPTPVEARQKLMAEAEQKKVKELQAGTESGGRNAVAEINQKTERELEEERFRMSESEKAAKRAERERLEAMVRELGAAPGQVGTTPPAGGRTPPPMDAAEINRYRDATEAAKVSEGPINAYENYDASSSRPRGVVVDAMNDSIRTAEVMAGDRDAEGRPLTRKAAGSDYAMAQTDARIGRTPTGPGAGSNAGGAAGGAQPVSATANSRGGFGAASASSPTLETAEATLPKVPLNDYVLSEGSLIKAVLITAINSQNPGDIVVRVTHDVYDSVSGQRLVIPRGSRLVGTYQGAAVMGLDRVGVGFKRLILTDGRSLELPQARGGDRGGQAGLPGDYHSNIWRAVGSAAAVGIISAMIRPSNQNTTVNVYGGGSPTTTSSGVIDQVAPKITEKILERYGTAKPYFTADAGIELSVFMTNDISIPPNTSKVYMR